MSRIIRFSSLQVIQIAIMAFSILLCSDSSVNSVSALPTGTLEGSKVVAYLRRLDNGDNTPPPTNTTTAVKKSNPPPKNHKKKASGSGGSSAATTSTTTTTSSSSSSSTGTQTPGADPHSDSSSSSNSNSNGHPGNKTPVFLLSAAAAGTLAVAAVTYKKKRKVEVKAHPLKGSVEKRMRMFSNLADRASAGAAGAVAGVGRKSGRGRGALDGDVGESELTGYRRASAENMGIAVV